MVTSDMSCPVRQQEKELDPLTILLNDVYEDTDIDDPIIQSLISDPTVPPPSSLKMPGTSTYEQPRPTYSQHSMFDAPAPMNIVTPAQDKQIVSLPEPAYVNTQQQQQPIQERSIEDLIFEDPFEGGLEAKDFFNSLVS
jgi:hypothetical protein